MDFTSKLIFFIIVFFMLMAVASCGTEIDGPTDIITVKTDFESEEYLNISETDIHGYKNSDLKKKLCTIKPRRQSFEKYSEKPGAYWVSANIKDCPRFFYVDKSKIVPKDKAPKLIKKGWKSSYQNIIHKNLKIRMLKYKNPWKWAKFIKAMAKAESNWNPNTFYVEKTIRDANGNNVVSRGLLQISIESAKGYGCHIKNQRQLHDPETNLRCGLKIMDKLLQRDSQVMGKKDGKWVGLSRYWSVLRAGTSGHKRFMKQYGQ